MKLGIVIAALASISKAMFQIGKRNHGIEGKKAGKSKGGGHGRGFTIKAGKRCRTDGFTGNWHSANRASWRRDLTIYGNYKNGR